MFCNKDLTGIISTMSTSNYDHIIPLDKQVSTIYATYSYHARVAIKVKEQKKKHLYIDINPDGNIKIEEEY